MERRKRSRSVGGFSRARRLSGGWGITSAKTASGAAALTWTKPNIAKGINDAKAAADKLNTHLNTLGNIISDNTVGALANTVSTAYNAAKDNYNAQYQKVADAKAQAAAAVQAAAAAASAAKDAADAAAEIP